MKSHSFLYDSMLINIIIIIIIIRWEENIKMDLQEVGCGGMD